MFKQQNPCSNHEIHVLFEHGFWTFDITTWALLCLRYVERRKRYRPEWSILEFYDDVRGSLRNWRHCKQHSELAALVCCRIWRVYMELWGVFIAICHWNRKLCKNKVHPWLFIAITFAGSLRRYFNTRPVGSVFKQLPRDPANVNAWKTMGDPYIKNIVPMLCACSHNVQIMSFQGWFNDV